MRNSLSKVHYLLLALLFFALTGCGANSTGTGSTTSKLADGKVAAKVQWASSKTAAKSVSLIPPASVTTVRLMVTGTNIPTARKDFPAADGGGTLEVFPGLNLVVTAYGLNASGGIEYEGFATDVIVTAGQTTNVGTINLSPPVVKAENSSCLSCHETTRDVDGQNLVVNYKQSGHYANLTNYSALGLKKFGAIYAGCAGCHGTQHNDLNPAASGRCYECHGAFLSARHSSVANLQTACGKCHQPHNTAKQTSCTGCHAVARNAGPGFVQDNNGVRAITQEFAKWSHHVTGVALNDAHCAACHLEGTVVGGNLTTDFTVHMKDAKTHLRNADTDADMQWDPAAPNHSTMDNFCMSCHDADGATSAMSVQIQAFINSNGLTAPGKTASAKNPFGDTISNRYDKMQRPGVIDVSGQFDVTNNSHHAVKGPRYSGRTRAAGPRQIASPATFAQNSSALLQGVRSTIYDAGNLNQLYEPLENAGGETAPRTGAQTLGDDSTLHCGDCHTVGQWKKGSSTTANGSPTPAAIGAHGSNNEYLLRNSLGTDERHTQNAFIKLTGNIVQYTNPNGAFLVCYNCHNYSKYGSIFLQTGVVGGHVGEYDDAGRCNGIGNTLPFNGYTTGTATDGTQFESRFNGPISKYGTTPAFAPGFPLNGTAPTGEQNPDFGNIFGIQCNNCHNSGAGNAYGGIHGSKNNTNSTLATVDPTVTGGAYIDGMGNTTKVERFLPGLGNAMHVPGTLGGFTGGTVAGPVTQGTNIYTYITGGVSNDTNWEQKHWQQTDTTVISPAGAVTGTLSRGAGCYTLGTGSAASALRGPSVTGEGGPATELFDTWGGCDDHNAAQGKGDHGFIKKIVRPITY
ncbi:MAG TPA: hypothetical protein VFF53_12225 [Geobacteraceae bacterium]|nr:hypothetical protein [Geobacteraceae bacterium]